MFSDINDDSLKEELRVCHHFLVDSQLEKGRQRVYNFGLDSLSTEKNQLKAGLCVSKTQMGFSNCFIEGASCRCFYAHEKTTLLEKSKLLRTGDDFEHLKTLLAGKDVIESCTRERVNVKWIFLKLTNVTHFAALLTDTPMGCKDTALPEPLQKNRTVNCLTFEQNTRRPFNDNLCLIRALCLHLQGNERFE